ncbi:MAG: amidohydrolase family protein [Candidatus Njordarchaeales archaeon]
MFGIKATVLFDGISKKENVYIVIDGNKIVEVTEKKPDIEIQYEGVVTPAFIDGHSHIGMARHGEPSDEEETNEHADIFLPTLDPLDSIYFDDKYFMDAVEFGVLYSCVTPGSGNLLGGKAVIIRNFAKDRDEAFIRHHGYKMALGFNPRSTWEWRGKRYRTRMGVYALLRDEFTNVLRKKRKLELDKKEKLREAKKKLEKGEITKEEYEEIVKEIEEKIDLEFELYEKALLEILNRKKVLKTHVHKEDDVLFLLRLIKEFNLKATADHLGDVHRVEIFRKIKEANVPIIYGPIDSFAYKTELKHDTYKNVKALIESKAKFTLMTDHPVMLARNLHLQLRYFLMYGLSEEKAISIITKEAAEILGISDILGTVEPGKLASLVVWNTNPFYLGAHPIAIIAEGKVIYKK